MRVSGKQLRALMAAVITALTIAASAEPLPVQTVEYASESVGRDLKFKLILPRGYESSTRRYPALYLLHGLTSNYTDWARMDVPQYASRYDMIIVMPDAGNSWYINWAETEGDQKNNWEDAIVKDLIGYVDGHYRTMARREGRAINGLSMGGYGAMMLGLRHPDLFCSIASHSGALAYARGQRKRMEEGNAPWVMWERGLTDKPNEDIGIEGFNSSIERTPKGKIFLTPEDCDRYDPFKLVMQTPVEKLPHIYLDCGTGDGLIKASRDFMKLMIENDIPFAYAQSAGGHQPSYWRREVGQSMAVQDQIIQRALAGSETEPAAP